ncbi:MAG TPA: calcium/sodium antiporter [Patescibacteria group bacterium]|nr:calcium/sodium antiporter [Patescibacteria group bacterium]
MIVQIVLFILGFIFLVKGADFLVDGASSIAKKYGFSSIMIGLTIVAFGTSLPELLVSALSAIGGSPDIAVGNILGSNFSNTLLILGATAVVTPLVVKKNTINKEVPFSLLAILAVGFLMNDSLIDGLGPNVLTRIDGLILLLFFIVFVYYTFTLKKERLKVLPKFKVSKEEDIKERKNYKSILLILLGIVGLYFGGEWIVSGAVEIATYFGLSEALIGLTIISIGTSLPELAASLIAAKKGEADMAVGAVVGSNIFNLLWVLGLSATIFPIAYNSTLNIDLILLIAITILLVPLIYAGRKNVLTKREGLILLGIYVFYLVFLGIRG